MRYTEIFFYLKACHSLVVFERGLHYLTTADFRLKSLLPQFFYGGNLRLYGLQTSACLLTMNFFFFKVSSVYAYLF